MFDGDLAEAVSALVSAAYTYRNVLFRIVGDNIAGKMDGDVSADPAVKVLREFEESLTQSETVIYAWLNELGIANDNAIQPEVQ